MVQENALAAAKAESTVSYISYASFPRHDDA
jgi:hypothetical protein